VDGKYIERIMDGLLGPKTACNKCGTYYLKHGTFKEERYQEHREG
jgi:hypothetical protein